MTSHGRLPAHQAKSSLRKICAAHSRAPGESCGSQSPGGTPGLAGDINEHFKVLFDDEEATLIIEAAEHLTGRGSHDSIDDGQRPHQRHRDGRHFPSECGAHDGTTMRLEVRACLRAHSSAHFPREQEQIVSHVRSGLRWSSIPGKRPSHASLTCSGSARSSRTSQCHLREWAR